MDLYYFDQPGLDPQRSQKQDFDHIKVKVKELWKIKMEPWRAQDAYNGGMEALTRTIDGLKTSGPRFASI
jgi:hypothetical protein